MKVTLYIGDSMKYRVVSLSIYGGSTYFDYETKQKALEKVRELKDPNTGSAFIVKLLDYTTI